MARRTRTAKFLGTRHNREYFRAWTRLRKLRVALTIALPSIACLWLLAHTVRGSSQPYSSGPMSPAHNVFGNDCEACHVNAKKFFGHASFEEHVSDHACLECHNSPVHQANEPFTPKCADCHAEHEGNAGLMTIADSQCAQCHRDLKVKRGTPRFERVVKSFAKDHPEFAPLRKPHDPGTVRLNHEAHMRAGISGPNGEVRMQCQDCHRPAADAAQPWPYSLRTVDASAPPPTPVAANLIATSLDPLPPSTGRAHMTPIQYDLQCAACHQLQFDERIADLVPHGKPEIIHDFVATRYREYLRAHPNAWRETPRPVRHIPRLEPPRPAHSPDEWVALQAAQAETLLWQMNCKLCHTIDYISGKPHIRPANITLRWLPNSTFNHYTHQSVACDSCHSHARTSRETADVLIPSIETCRKCHSGEPSRIGSAGNNCSLCHQYHDWTHQQPGLKGHYTIEQLLSRHTSSSPYVRDPNNMPVPIE
jgi:hypothetical protein